MLEIIQGNCLDVLKTLDSESVQCCVTSPPYFALRAYGTEPQIWGGSDACTHEWTYSTSPGLRGGTNQNAKTDNPKLPTNRRVPDRAVATCKACNAWQCELGAEPMPELYVKHLVKIFREVRRVLCNDGTLWLNLGDSYYGSRKGSGGAGVVSSKQHTNKGANFAMGGTPVLYDKRSDIKSKDLVGIPFMVAFALRAEGWFLRSDIIWNKPNPMPESVTDRPTKSHEYIFLLSKRANYYYDSKAISEELKGESFERAARAVSDTHKNLHIPGQAQHSMHRARANGEGYQMPERRNKRSVWTINVGGYSGAHFATFPPALVEPCILAGSRQGDVVLDPFAGSGTVGKVALELGRRALLIELNREYISLIEKRCQTTLGLPLRNTAV